MKNILYVFELAAYAIGTIGGIGYSIYSHSGYVIPVCIGALAVMAFPQARKAWNILSGKEDA